MRSREANTYGSSRKKDTKQEFSGEIKGKMRENMYESKKKGVRSREEDTYGSSWRKDTKQREL